MATTTHFRTCHLCEAMCGLAIEHEGERIVAIRGDRDDPLSRGYMCPKGAALGQLHDDPDRLRRPLRKTREGWREIGWDEALDLAAERLHAIQVEQGRDSVAVYLGNPAVHHHGTLLFALPFLRQLRTRHRYSATSVDQLPQMLVSYLMYGHQLLMPVPDIDRASWMLVVGANPLVSNGSIMSAPDMRRRLRDLQARGGKLVVLDPRRSETAQMADEHHFVRPGHDAALLLAMLHVILGEGRERAGRLLEFVDGLPRLRVALERFTPERAERHAGVPAEDIRRLARELVDRRGVVYGRVGASVQQFGSLTHWAIQLLNVFSGALDRPGGSMFARPAIDPLSLPKAIAGGPGHFGRWRSRVRGLPEFGGELPVASLAEDIVAGSEPGSTSGEGQLGPIRALLTLAGNPVLSSPGGHELGRALGRLEFVVCIDMYLNETSRHADLILPPCSPLERSHYDLALQTFAVRNTAKWSAPMFEPGPESRADWQIVHGLATRIDRLRGAGLQQRLTHAAAERLGPEGMLDLALRVGPHGDLLGRKLGLARLREHPHGIDLGPLEPCLPERLQGPRKRIDLIPELLLADLGRLERATPLELPAIRLPSAERPEFTLISRRQLRSNNSWMHNLPKLMAGKPRCTLLMHPEDAESLGLRPGDRVAVRSTTGAIEVELELGDEANQIMRGVVSLPHGFGHRQPGVRMQVAEQPDNAGASINDLIDPRRIDELSGVAALSGESVRVALVLPD
ncbi:molybdopterin-dependent oxidoreductase [Nannocystaceae bacterium ST9]